MNKSTRQLALSKGIHIALSMALASSTACVWAAECGINTLAPANTAYRATSENLTAITLVNGTKWLAMGLQGNSPADAEGPLNRSRVLSATLAAPGTLESFSRGADLPPLPAASDDSFASEPNPKITAIASSGQTVVAISFNGGVYVSPDAGVSWAAAHTHRISENSGTGGAHDFRGLTVTANGTWVAVAHVPGTGGGAGANRFAIFTTTNPGNDATWTGVTPTGVTGAVTEVNAVASVGATVIAVGSANPGVSSYLAFSSDNGATWSQSSPTTLDSAGLGKRAHSIAAIPNGAAPEARWAVSTLEAGSNTPEIFTADTTAHAETNVWAAATTPSPIAGEDYVKLAGATVGAGSLWVAVSAAATPVLTSTTAVPNAWTSTGASSCDVPATFSVGGQPSLYGVAVAPNGRWNAVGDNRRTASSVGDPTMGQADILTLPANTPVTLQGFTVE